MATWCFKLKELKKGEIDLVLMYKNFPFHKVCKRPWPIIVSFSVLGMLLNSVLYFHKISNSFFLFFFFFSTIFFRFIWWKDVLKEGEFGFHKNFVINNFYIGMIILIIREVFFFSRFFWAFFHKCWNPGIELGKSWPPLKMKGIVVDPFSVPFLKTVILLSSGVTVTWVHKRILKKKKKKARLGMIFTVILGVIFLILQGMEYSFSSIRFNSMVYGSCFFLLTGFHGGHVIVGTIFLFFKGLRFLKNTLVSHHHVGLELAIWYWHFVDVVWLFLFIFVYWYTRNVVLKVSLKKILNCRLREKWICLLLIRKRIRLQLKKRFWEDSKKWRCIIFFFLAKFCKFIIISRENYNLIMIFLHLKTIFSLPFIFLFKENWESLIQYLVFQLVGRVFVEIGLRFTYFFSNFLVGLGILIKLGKFPFLWWFPLFLKKKNWFNFFFFKTFNKFPLIYLWSNIGINLLEKLILSVVVLGAVLGMWFRRRHVSNKFKIKYLLGWASIIDTSFLCWLRLENLEMFSLVFCIYTLMYLFFRLIFYFLIKKKKKVSSIFFKKKNSFFFFLGRIIFLFFVGFPPLFPFLFKFFLIRNFFLKKKYGFILLFFFISLLQSFVYLKVFLLLMKKKKSYMQMSISLFYFSFFFFFFFFFFW